MLLITIGFIVNFFFTGINPIRCKPSIATSFEEEIVISNVIAFEFTVSASWLVMSLVVSSDMVILHLTATRLAAYLFNLLRCCLNPK
jgi:hypothetical protein